MVGTTRLRVMEQGKRRRGVAPMGLEATRQTHGLSSRAMHKLMASLGDPSSTRPARLRASMRRAASVGPRESVEREARPV